MNDVILLQLKILVETAVRPIRASIAQKRKMRAELLAHLIAVFEEECKRGDESAALARTAQRFGEATELTRQLQAAVPRGDGLVHAVEWFAGVPTREHVLRRAVRYASVIAIFSALFLVVFGVATGQWRQWTTLARLPSLLAPFWLAGLAIWGTVLEHWMRHALFGSGGRRWMRAVGVGLLSWLLLPCLVLTWSIAISGNVLFSVLETWPLFPLSLLAPLVLTIIVYACIGEIQYLEEWASLPIDSQEEWA
jgi:hypothetical protein